MKRFDLGIDSLYWCLDKMLLRKVEQGVYMYILFYWELKKIVGMDFGSEYVENVLSYKNIEVFCYLDMNIFLNYIFILFWWSYYEKVVVVDWSIVFVGGIDFCFG